VSPVAVWGRINKLWYELRLPRKTVPSEGDATPQLKDDALSAVLDFQTLEFRLQLLIALI
jgi:hypothetical protein